MKKLLLIGSKSGEIVTGLSIGFDLLLEGLQKRTIEHTVINKSLQFKGHKAGTIDLKSLFKTVFVYMAFLKNIMKAQVVYTTISSSTFGFLRDSFFILISSKLNKDIILHLYGGGFGIFYSGKSPLAKKLIKKTIDRAKKIIVEGELLKQQFSFVRDYKNRVKVVPNGLPQDIDTSDLKSKNLNNARPFNFLYLSNMIESKGYLDLLKACDILNQRGVDFKCHFAGDFFSTKVDGNQISKRKEKQNFFNFIKTYNLDKKIFFHGLVKGEDKTSLLKNATVFVLPTYYPWEGQPFSIIEAMSFGTPIISTNYRGIPEQLIDEHNGYFVESKNPKDLARVLTKTTNSEDNYARLSQNSIEHFLQNFTKEAHLKKLMNEITN